MDKLTTIGKIFYAIALIGLGSTHFIFEGFMTGRAPAWPEQLPGGLIWAYLSGTIFIMLGIAILAGKKAREAAIFAGILIFFWALLRQIPVVAADSILGVAWTAAGKALTFSGGALAIAATFPKVEGNRSPALLKFLNLKNEFILTGRICLGLFLINSGIQHFIFTEFVASLIPGWFPGDAVFWTYFAAVALIAGGIGLFIPQTARLAALLSGGMIFSWFWVVHIPLAFQSVSSGIAVFEALAVAGIAFVLAGFLYGQKIKMLL